MTLLSAQAFMQSPVATGGSPGGGITREADPVARPGVLLRTADNPELGVYIRYQFGSLEWSLATVQGSTLGIAVDAENDILTLTYDPDSDTMTDILSYLDGDGVPADPPAGVSAIEVFGTPGGIVRPEDPGFTRAFHHFDPYQTSGVDSLTLSLTNHVLGLRAGRPIGDDLVAPDLNLADLRGGLATIEDARLGIFEDAQSDSDFLDTFVLNDRAGIIDEGYKWYMTGSGGTYEGMVIRRNGVALDTTAPDHGLAKYFDVILGGAGADDFIDALRLAYSSASHELRATAGRSIAGDVVSAPLDLTPLIEGVDASVILWQDSDASGTTPTGQSVLALKANGPAHEFVIPNYAGTGRRRVHVRVPVAYRFEYLITSGADILPTFSTQAIALTHFQYDSAAFAHNNPLTVLYRLVDAP